MNDKTPPAKKAPSRRPDGVVTLEQVAAHPAPVQLLAPVDALLSTFPAIALGDELAKRFLHGQRLALGKEDVALPTEQGRVRVYHGERLLGTGILGEFSILAPERLIAFTG